MLSESTCDGDSNSAATTVVVTSEQFSREPYRTSPRRSPRLFAKQVQSPKPPRKRSPTRSTPVRQLANKKRVKKSPRIGRKAVVDWTSSHIRVSSFNVAEPTSSTKQYPESPWFTIGPNTTQFIPKVLCLGQILGIDSYTSRPNLMQRTSILLDGISFDISQCCNCAHNLSQELVSFSILHAKWPWRCHSYASFCELLSQREIPLNRHLVKNIIHTYLSEVWVSSPY